LNDVKRKDCQNIQAVLSQLSAKLKFFYNFFSFPKSIYNLGASLEHFPFRPLVKYFVLSKSFSIPIQKMITPDEGLKNLIFDNLLRKNALNQ